MIKAQKFPQEVSMHESKSSNLIYSKSFIIKTRELDICKICPSEIENLKIILEIRPLQREIKDMRYKQKEGQKFKIPDKTEKQWVRVGTKNPWKDNQTQIESVERTVMYSNVPPDIKRMTGILNKLTAANYDKMVEDTKTFNYSSPEVVSIIFKKIILEPYFSEIYSKFCKKLIGLHQLINDLCIDEFKKNKHKNLVQFIGELYKLDLINDLNSFINVFTEDITEENLEMLSKLISTIGPANPIFIELIQYLDEKFFIWTHIIPLSHPCSAAPLWFQLATVKTAVYYATFPPENNPRTGLRLQLLGHARPSCTRTRNSSPGMGKSGGIRSQSLAAISAGCQSPSPCNFIGKKSRPFAFSSDRIREALLP